METEPGERSVVETHVKSLLFRQEVKRESEMVTEVVAREEVGRQAGAEEEVVAAPAAANIPEPPTPPPLPSAEYLRLIGR